MKWNKKSWCREDFVKRRQSEFRSVIFADVYEIVWNVQGKILWYIVKLGANKSGESLQEGA